MDSELAAEMPPPQAESGPGATLVMAKGYLDGSAADETYEENDPQDPSTPSPQDQSAWNGDNELEDNGLQSPQDQSIWNVIENPTNGDSQYQIPDGDSNPRSNGEPKPHVQTAPKLSAIDELVSGPNAAVFRPRNHLHWAPLRIPFQRRLQTLVVLLHTLSISLFLSFFFLLCAIPIVWPVLLPYLVYVLLSSAGISGKSTRRSHFFRSMPYWSLFASYFPARLHRSQELPSTRKYIFGYHPHGIISHGAFAAFATNALGFEQLFPGITNSLLTLDSNFRIPFYRDFILALGLASVSKESCENILKTGGRNGEGMGRAITIVIGGARESLDAVPGTLRLVLRRRKGFVKLAIRTGADLVPVLGFGENDLYEQVNSDSHPLIHHAQMFIKKAMGFTIPLFHARGVFNYDVGLLPYRRPLNIVVGRPIKVVQQATPDEAYMDQLHGAYVDELRRLWDRWKDTFAKDRTGEMEMIE
ncbi:MAG: diacylglycerol O-acyltransferase 1 [Watsoniomyces obsoletus]|nr:MAG: diacylglycerol O-acyltransferase 1 [Watsoniomyces obsoletus]